MLSVIVRNNVSQRSCCGESSVIDGLTCTREYGSSKAEEQCLQNDVSQIEGTKLNTSDVRADPAHRIRPVGPTWLDPWLFNAIRSDLGGVC